MINGDGAFLKMPRPQFINLPTVPGSCGIPALSRAAQRQREAV